MAAPARQTLAPTVPAGWLSAALFLIAIATSAYVWVRIALPVLMLEDQAIGAHRAHLQPVLVHALGGTIMLFAGAAALYIGSTRRYFRGHRWFGYTYLAGGSVGSLAALYLVFSRAHENVGINAATGTLAAVWLAVALMAYRAARNRRFDVHREWMIRSFVLTWTFVLCRMVQSTPSMANVDGETVAAVIWVAWVGPMVICELALQWRRTSRL